jgi:hypothetical protein
VTTALIRGVLPGLPKLVAVIGLFPGDHAAELGAAPDEIIDLDRLDLGAALDAPRSGVVAVIARTATDLRRAASLAGLFPAARHLLIGVVQSPAHRPLALPAVLRGWHTMRSLQAHRGPDGDWLVEARFAHAIPAGEFLAATVRGLDGQRMQASPPARAALAGAGAGHWRPGDPGVTPASEQGPLGDPGQFLPADLVLRSTGPRPAHWPDERVPVVDRLDTARSSWARLGAPGGMGEVRSVLPLLSDADSVPPVDERSVNPTGFLCAPELGTGVLAQAGDCWSVRLDRRDIVRFHPSGAVTDADVAGLRRLRAVDVHGARHMGPQAAVRLLAGLAAAGIPLCAARVPPWGRALGTEIIDLVTGADAQSLADDLRREEYSIRLRRAALRAHSVRRRWRGLAASAGLAVEAEPRVSVILCTRRADFLDSALRQISRQRHVELELVLTLHGISADHPEVRSALAAFDRPATVVEVPRDVPFGLALNRGVARAAGHYIAKWDDDDWYGPDFLADMLLAHSYSGADLVGGLSQLVYLEQIDLTVLRRGGESERDSRYISGGTLVMHRHVFDAVAGFRPLRRHVDTGLLRAIEAAGGRIYRTHGLGYMLHRRAAGHTWQQPVTRFLRASTRQWKGFRPSALIAADTLPAELPKGAEIEDVRDA